MAGRWHPVLGPGCPPWRESQGKGRCRDTEGSCARRCLPGEVAWGTTQGTGGEEEEEVEEKCGPLVSTLWPLSKVSSVPSLSPHSQLAKRRMVPSVTETWVCPQPCMGGVEGTSCLVCPRPVPVWLPCGEGR